MSTDNLYTISLNKAESEILDNALQALLETITHYSKYVGDDRETHDILTKRQFRIRDLREKIMDATL